MPEDPLSRWQLHCPAELMKEKGLDLSIQALITCLSPLRPEGPRRLADDVVLDTEIEIAVLILGNLDIG